MRKSLKDSRRRSKHASLTIRSPCDGLDFAARICFVVLMPKTSKKKKPQKGLKNTVTAVGPYKTNLESFGKFLKETNVWKAPDDDPPTPVFTSIQKSISNIEKMGMEKHIFSKCCPTGSKYIWHFANGPWHSSVTLTGATVAPIKFCPYCGENLILPVGLAPACCSWATDHIHLHENGWTLSYTTFVNLGFEETINKGQCPYCLTALPSVSIIQPKKTDIPKPEVKTSPTCCAKGYVTVYRWDDQWITDIAGVKTPVSVCPFCETYMPDPSGCEGEGFNTHPTCCDLAESLGGVVLGSTGWIKKLGGKPHGCPYCLKPLPLIPVASFVTVKPLEELDGSKETDAAISSCGTTFHAKCCLKGSLFIDIGPKGAVLNKETHLLTPGTTLTSCPFCGAALDSSPKAIVVPKKNKKKPFSKSNKKPYMVPKVSYLGKKT